MKYLKDKNSRRRGVAIELAVGMLLIMMAMSTIIVVTTMIQIEKQKNSVIDLNNLITDIERIEYNQVGLYFESIVYDEILSLDSFGDSEDETIRSRKTLNDLSFLFLTNDDQDDQQLLKSNVETFQNEIVKSLKDKLEQKFEVLKNHRSLEFEITIGDIYKDDNTNPISPITQINYIDEEEGDIVTKTKTIVLEYNLTFALNLNVVNGETSRTVFSVENNMVLNREASLVSKYIKQYKLIPIEEEVKYTIENEFVELYLKEGHYLSFKGKEGIESLTMTVLDDEENVEDFTIQPPNSNESNDDNQENEQQDSLKQDDWRIVANEGSSGKSVNITLGYKKKVTIENTEPEQGGSDENTSDEPVVTNESTDGTEEEIPSYVEKILKIKITSVTEYPVIDENQENTNSGENEDTSGDTDVQPENPSVPDVDDSTNPGESTPDGSDDETENETPKPIELDIIIKRQTGVDKVYIENGDVHQSDTYSYEISITNPDEKPERTHWEYN